ncbi:unnamed protein product [Cuscuta campestris]|uniref:BAH domain-containing protein n=1 Tax=Cuscuta campestris TaxID=132261 RepID=A0A484MIX9_9ASTE|nr:unnamed protein product [Cuscuta campestris]
MAKNRHGKRDLHSFTIRGTNKVVRAGECVLMRSPENEAVPYVGHVEKIEADDRNNVNVTVRWYYRPEETKGGRQQFHGTKELMLSDHYDVQSADTVEGKCRVHSFAAYTELPCVGPEDYYCRFEYKAAAGTCLPDRVVVYCKCQMPYNPDDIMMQCEACMDWYHPRCVDMSIQQAKQLDQYICTSCEHSKKRPNQPSSTLPASINNDKDRSKRQKR